MLKHTAALSICLLSVWLAAGTASAQVFTPTITPNASLIKVNQTTEQGALRPKVADQRLVSLAFGATANGGNSKTYAGNLGGRFGLIKDRHQITVEALGSLGGSRRNMLTGVDLTSGNVIARARYDLFLSQWDAVFIAVAPRHDSFAGLDLRLQNQIGYLRNLFFPVDAHRVWTEAGYDFTYDNIGRVKGGTATPSTMPVSGKSDGDNPFIHSARLFFGYTNRLSPGANLSVGVENLFEFKHPKNVRVNGLVELTSSITQSFKLGLQSRLLFDNVPVPGTKTYDIIAVAQLVYTFDSNAAAAVPVCPVCDCSSQVTAARNACKAPPP